MFLVTFAILASPAYFRFLHSVVGGWAASSEGLAKPAGLFIAGLVFMLVLTFQQRISGYDGAVGTVTSGKVNISAALAASNPCDRAKFLQKALDKANDQCSALEP